MNTEYIKKYQEALYRDMFSPLFRFVYFRVKNTDTANDITQETFLRFLKKYSQNREDLHNKKILFTISRNILIDFYRKRSFRKDESLESLDIDIESFDDNPEKESIKSEKKTVLKELLNILSDEEEEIVLIRNTSNMSYKEISDILKISEENARKIYSRAIKKMSDYANLKNIKYE